MNKEINNKDFESLLYNIKTKLSFVRNKDNDLMYSEICLDSAMLLLETSIPDLEYCVLTKNIIEKYLKNENNISTSFIYSFYCNERESLEDDY